MVTVNQGTPDEQTGAEETTVLRRSDLDDHAAGVDSTKESTGARGPASGASAWGSPRDGQDSEDATEAIVVQPAIGAHAAWQPAREQAAPARNVVAEPMSERTAPAETATVAAPMAATPVATPASPSPDRAPTAETKSTAETKTDRGTRNAAVRSRRSHPGEETVVVPAHRPWTMVLAGILALLWGLEAAFELVFNWSRVRGVPTPPGRYGIAAATVDHASTSVAHFIAQVALNKHFMATRDLDLRLALGAFAVVWVIVGLLLLVARGSGIRLGLLACGLVALPAFGLVRGGTDRYGWHLDHLAGAALTGAFAAPFILTVLIALLTGTRRARLFSGRPAEEFLDVNDPGEVWRDR